MVTVIHPAERTRNVRYAVRDIVVLAEQAAKAGKELLYLNIGDPNKFDFETPRPLIEAAYRAMLANANGYSPSSGTKQAVDAVAREAARKGITNVQDIFVTSGASEGIDLCLSALADPGDDVLVPSPGYPLYTAVLARLEVRENSYYLDEANGWQPSVSDIASKITPRTRAIAIIHPNNPTGSFASDETLLGILDLARRHDLVVLADEIYDRLLFDGRTPRSIAALAPDVPCVTFGGLSKVHVGPGWRLGWGIASGPGEAMAPFLAALNQLLRARLCANHPLQAAIPVALDGGCPHLPEVMARLTRRRDLTVRMLNEIPGITCVRPEGAFYAFPRLHIAGTDTEWVHGLIRETGVVVVPGSGFGQVPGTQHFRVVFLPDERTLEKAYRQIAAWQARWLDTHPG